MYVCKYVCIYDVYEVGRNDLTRVTRQTKISQFLEREISSGVG